MSKVALKGDALGTGTVTLSAPNTNDVIDFELPITGTHLASAQAGGMPLGQDGDPVVESGSNSDGEWDRWANGVQHCRVYSGTSPGDSAAYEWALPVPLPFTAVEQILSGLHRGSNQSLQPHMTSTRSVAGQAVDPQVKVWISTAFFHQCSVLIIGRWK